MTVHSLDREEGPELERKELCDQMWSLQSIARDPNPGTRPSFKGIPRREAEGEHAV